MPFTTETARESGKKSKRGKDKIAEEIREILHSRAEELIKVLDIQALSSSQKLKALSIILPYLISKSDNFTKSKNQIDEPIFLYLGKDVNE